MLFNTGVFSPPGHPIDQSRCLSGITFRSASQSFSSRSHHLNHAPYTRGQEYTLAPSTGVKGQSRAALGPLQNPPKALQADAQPQMEPEKARVMYLGPNPTLWPRSRRGPRPHQGHHIQPFRNSHHHSTHMCAPHWVAEASGTVAE